jgi:hypothetical protein
VGGGGGNVRGEGCGRYVGGVCVYICLQISFVLRFLLWCGMLSSLQQNNSIEGKFKAIFGNEEKIRAKVLYPLPFVCVSLSALSKLVQQLGFFRWLQCFRKPIGKT